MSDPRHVRLNTAQHEAVEHAQGPLLVLAGAGSGKTRVITHRIARLIDRGVRPESILAVSFTNKAAAEMHERMIPLIGRGRADALWLSTFHSFGVRFLNEEVKALGYPSRFAIFDQGDSLGLVREIVRREGIGDRQMDLYAILSRISLWKNAGIAPGAPAPSDYEYDVIASQVYPHYTAALRNMCALDFDDLVHAPVAILERCDDIREKWRGRFRHLLIDEFQDTNKIQLDLVRQLANSLNNVCVVGDDDQSIYGWRGAEVGNILDFERHFEGTKVVILEENYRSRQPILEVANEAIARSKGPRHEKVLRAARGPGEKVRILVTNDVVAEAKTVALEIRHLRDEHRIRLSEIAVLYRSNKQARPIEEELRVHGFPYRVFGGGKFFDKKEVRDAVAYLRAVVYPRDELSLRRIINYPTRGIGDTTIERLTRHANARGITFADAVSNIDDIEDIPDVAKRGARVLNAALSEARARFATNRDLADAAGTLFREVGLERRIREDKNASMRKRWANVEYVLRSLRRYETSGDSGGLGAFLTRISLDSDPDAKSDEDAVTLSSLHAAKGLEFRLVFLIGLNEGVLPHQRTVDPKLTDAAPTDVEEERRLFYVGVTRARDILYLCRPQKRVMRGRITPLVPSRFFEGLPEDQLEYFEREYEEPVETAEALELGRALLEALRSS